MRRLTATICALLVWPASALAVQRFPAPDFKSGYEMPQTVVPPAEAPWWNWLDVSLLAAALLITAWMAFKARSRRGVFWVMVLSLAYFGFVREGCVCAVGSIQNVAYSAGGNGYTLPLTVALIFMLPLLAALFFGRVFCAGVCPLGAIQDVVLWKPIHLPPWLEHGLGLFAYVYLGLGVMYAAVGSDFVICRYDPFVSFFRFSGAAHIIFIGAVMLAACMFVGRIYCRFICPYSVLLRLLSPFSKQRVSITPEECVDCRLCEQSCPFGAIRYPTPREPVGRRGSDRRRLGIALAAVPLLAGLFAAVGYASSGVFARADFTVRLAERIYEDERKPPEKLSDEAQAFRNTGEPVEALYARAAAIQKRFAVGATLFGAWMGVVVGLKLVSLVMRRRAFGYTADPSNCLACARCYDSCPIEIEHRQRRQLEVITA